MAVEGGEQRQTERAMGHVMLEPVDGPLLIERDKMKPERKQRTAGTVTDRSRHGHRQNLPPSPENFIGKKCLL